MTLRQSIVRILRGVRYPVAVALRGTRHQRMPRKLKKYRTQSYRIQHVNMFCQMAEQNASPGAQVHIVFSPERHNFRFRFSPHAIR
jgi:hypothetical protein